MIKILERLGVPRTLMLGFLAVAIFMTGDGFELTFLSKFMVDQGFTSSQASLLVTVYGLFAAFGGWSAGVLAEMFGARKVMMFGACWWIGVHLLFLGVAIPSHIYPLILGLYAIRGIGYPLFIYSFVVLMAQYISPSRLASATGFFWTCFSLGIGVFAVIVIFQPELRRLLEQLGKGNLSRLLTPADNKDEIEEAIGATVAACADMSRSRTGVLIVFERRERLGEIVATGTLLDADPSPELLKNIFFKNSPLHDGALIMRDGRICAAGCVLPLSGSQNLSRDLGTRHRAALGMSENSDAVVVVVSEETGIISLAKNGVLIRRLDRQNLFNLLEGDMVPPAVEEKKRPFWRRKHEKQHE